MRVSATSDSHGRAADGHHPPGAAPSAGDRTQYAAPCATDKRRQLADSIDARLIGSPGWEQLAATTDQCARNGIAIESRLSRLAARAPITSDEPALELQYRLLDAVHTGNSAIVPAYTSGVYLLA